MFDLISIQENLRSQLLKFEALNSDIEKLPGRNFRDLQVKEKLKNLSNTCAADILIFNDFCSELSECNNETDLDILLEADDEI